MLYENQGQHSFSLFPAALHCVHFHVGEEVFVSPVLSVLLVQESFCWRLLLLSGTIPDLAAKIQISNTQSPGIDVVVQCSLAYRKLCSMLRIDVSQGLPLLNERCYQSIQSCHRFLLHLWLVSGLCVPALCHSICLLCGVVYSVGLAFSASAANIADVGRFLQLLARIVIVCPTYCLAVHFFAGVAHLVAIFLPTQTASSASCGVSAAFS